eukprot:1097163-Pelagomonas_calceolata.AAC.7
MEAFPHVLYTVHLGAHHKGQRGERCNKELGLPSPVGQACVGMRNSDQTGLEPASICCRTCEKAKRVMGRGAEVQRGNLFFSALVPHRTSGLVLGTSDICLPRKNMSTCVCVCVCVSNPVVCLPLWASPQRLLHLCSTSEVFIKAAELAQV